MKRKDKEYLVSDFIGDVCWSWSVDNYQVLKNVEMT